MISNDVQNKLVDNFISYTSHVCTNNKVSHSYLIELNDCEKDFHYVISFVKMILFSCTYRDIDSMDKLVVDLIDHNNYPDFRIIEPDGSYIKKNQLIDLQNDFSNKSLFDNKRIYVIKYADQLNLSASNTILKFLEEPAPDIVAILVTENRFKIIETIQSRCQILSLKNDNICFDEAIPSELVNIFISPVLFFKKYNYFLNNYFSDKETVRNYFSSIENFFIAFVEFKMFNNYFEIFSSYDILNLTDIDFVIKIITSIESELLKLDYNVNLKLWLDNFFSILLIGG